MKKIEATKPLVLKPQTHSPERYIELSAEELARCKVILSDGQLKWAHDNTPVSTLHWTGKSSIGICPVAVSGLAAYAVDLEGNLYIHEHITGISHGMHVTRFFTHSSFFGEKQPGLCFGMIIVENGFIKHIDNESGHYQPPKANFEVLLAMLNIDLKAEHVYYADHEEEARESTTPNPPTRKPSALVKQGSFQMQKTNSVTSIASSSGTFVVHDSREPSPTPF